MKIKYFFIAIVTLILFLSIAQTFSIFPYAEDVLPLFKSGYFAEIDRSFELEADSFIRIKMYTQPVLAWAYLSDIEKKHGIIASVYNDKGQLVEAPGIAQNQYNPEVTKILQSGIPKMSYYVRGGKYYAALPIEAKKECGFCHRSKLQNGTIGVITFERDIDSRTYFTFEKRLFFIFLSVALLVLLFAVILWDPERKVKELFDKS